MEVAKILLSGTESLTVDMVEMLAFALMYLPDEELIKTHKRLSPEADVSLDMTFKHLCGVKSASSSG